MESWLSGVPPQGQGQGADLRPAQLRRRQPQARDRHAPRCCARSRGEVWLTETGGILKFLPTLPALRDAPGEARTKYMFKLADRYDTRRSRHALADHAALQLPVDRRRARAPRFDAGLVNPTGSPRKAYKAFKKLEAKHD